MCMFSSRAMGCSIEIWVYLSFYHTDLEPRMQIPLLFSWFCILERNCHWFDNAFFIYGCRYHWFYYAVLWYGCKYRVVYNDFWICVCVCGYCCFYNDSDILECRCQLFYNILLIRGCRYHCFFGQILNSECRFNYQKAMVDRAADTIVFVMNLGLTIFPFLHLLKSRPFLTRHQCYWIYKAHPFPNTSLLFLLRCLLGCKI